MMPALPSPCMTRIAISMTPEGESAAAIEANAVSHKPPTKVRRRPWVSPRAPAVSNPHAAPSGMPLMIHACSSGDSARAAVIASRVVSGRVKTTNDRNVAMAIIARGHFAGFAFSLSVIGCQP